jgi:acetyl-CoA carboxylase biotin carboxylase subunit
VFRKVLVANRGEIAVRVIRALHELDVEAVAVYSTADEGALHTRLADEAVRIGPPPAGESYLSIPAIVAAAVNTGCDAVHPGYGFLSENPAFVEAGGDNDLVFVGPPAAVMEAMGDKGIAARSALRAADVPTVPGTERDHASGGARGQRPRSGYPVMLKAAAGRSRGMPRRRPVGARRSLRGRLAEAGAAFGDGTLYLEKVLSPARHVEIR